MPARKLDGSAAAAAVTAELRKDVESVTGRIGRPPSLAILLVGDDPASQVYVRHKETAGAGSGLAVVVHRMPSTAALEDVLSRVAALNADDRVDGILVQAPLPAGMGSGAAARVFDAILPQKDVDGFHPANVGRLVQGRPVMAPCTPAGVIELLQREGIEIAGKHAVVIGRSDIVGKPMALLLLQHNATVTVCHSRTQDLPGVVSRADIVVSAIGRPGFVTPDMIKPGAVVVDVGTTPVSDKELVGRLFGAGSPRLATIDRRGSTVVGDVHPGVLDVASAVSPVPGGVGPLTIAMLLKNTLTAARARAGS